MNATHGLNTVCEASEASPPSSDASASAPSFVPQGHDAVSRILSLREGEVFIERGRGPCASESGDHSVEDGYSYFEWRVRVDRVGSDRKPFDFSVEERTGGRGPWTKTDFGMSVGSGTGAFVWFCEAERVPAVLALFRALRDNEEAEHDDPEWREANGVTDEVLRSGRLTEATRAKLEKDRDDRLARIACETGVDEEYWAERREIVGSFVDLTPKQMETIVKVELETMFGPKPPLRVIESYLHGVVNAVAMTKEGLDFFNVEDHERRNG